MGGLNPIGYKANEMGRKEKKRRKNKSTILFVVLFITGFLIMAYPFISNCWNQMRTESQVRIYSEEIDSLSDAELDKEFEKAKAYNQGHTANTVLDVFGNINNEEKLQYMSLLNPLENGVMGYIEIPRIKQRIVIYHGTSKEVLEKGCGHIAGTSLPVGGNNSHSVIAAHRGLPRAKLFTDLDQLEEGDEFYLLILNKTLAYEIDQIKVVEPDCLEDLQIRKGKDYVTLFTCTPYSVNTHRLLVRGHRIPYIPANNTTQTVADTLKRYLLPCMIISLLLFMGVYIIRRIIKGGG